MKITEALKDTIKKELDNDTGSFLLLQCEMLKARGDFSWEICLLDSELKKQCAEIRQIFNLLWELYLKMLVDATNAIHNAYSRETGYPQWYLHCGKALSEFIFLIGELRDAFFQRIMELPENEHDFRLKWRDELISCLLRVHGGFANTLLWACYSLGCSTAWGLK